MRFKVLLFLLLNGSAIFAVERISLGKLENFEIKIDQDSIYLYFNAKILMRVSDKEPLNLSINRSDSLLKVNALEFDFYGKKKTKKRWEKHCDADQVLEVIPINDVFFIVNNFQSSELCFNVPLKNRAGEDSLIEIDGYMNALYPVFKPSYADTYIYDRKSDKVMMENQFYHFNLFYDYLIASTPTLLIYEDYPIDFYKRTVFSVNKNRIQFIDEFAKWSYTEKDSFFAAKIPIIDSIVPFSSGNLSLIYTKSGIDLWQLNKTQTKIENFTCYLTNQDSIVMLAEMPNTFIAYNGQQKTIGHFKEGAAYLHPFNSVHLKTYTAKRKTINYKPNEFELSVISFSPQEHVFFDRSYWMPKITFVNSFHPLTELDSNLQLINKAPIKQLDF